ncbi:MAG: hypothetical protein WC797_03375 [Candidatus Paceibacterota bacterium]|jgi:hypothetical protein
MSIPDFAISVIVVCVYFLILHKIDKNRLRSNLCDKWSREVNSNNYAHAAELAKVREEVAIETRKIVEAEAAAKALLVANRIKLL